MITIMDYIVSNKINGIDSDAAFLRSIKFINIYNVYKIKKGTQGFRPEHFEATCKVYNVDMNYIFNEKHLFMFLQNDRQVSVYYKLLEVVHMVGLEINK